MNLGIFLREDNSAHVEDLTLDSSCTTHGNDATVPALPHPSRRSATELIHLHSMTYDYPSARTVSPLLSDDKGNIRLF